MSMVKPMKMTQLDNDRTENEEHDEIYSDSGKVLKIMNVDETKQ